ncbi:hypothetical protein HYT04_01430 [Candidatus Kaiserbacteria bacterium]|nr:hypothetical protein [Candidatus Kaiserbacteria bacterium]
MDADTVNRFKELAKDPAFLSEMKEVFFDAMMAGYASATKVQKATIVELPGSKLAPPYERGPWLVVDPYLVTPMSSYSGGMTVILYERMPVWMMQYYGSYPAEAIPCLKAALRETYSKRQFFGGRGPTNHFSFGEFYYLNEIDDGYRNQRDHFKLFAGSEWVGHRNAKVGWHMYKGGLML